MIPFLWKILLVTLCLKYPNILTILFTLHTPRVGLKKGGGIYWTPAIFQVLEREIENVKKMTFSNLTEFHLGSGEGGQINAKVND